MIHPRADDLADMVVVERIKDGLALPARTHQTGAAQDAQLVGDGALSHGQPLRQMENAQLLRQIAVARNLLRAGSEPDYQRASKMVLDDFRNGKTGRISLETPPEGGEDGE